MPIAKTMTLMIPVRNVEAAPLRLSLESMRRQSLQFDEIVVSDFASYEPFKSDIEELCSKYQKELNVKYVYTSPPDIDLEIPERVLDKILSVHLWQMNYNIGIRNSSSELIIISGSDRVFADDVSQIMLDFYNQWCERTPRKEAWLSGRVRDLSRVPEVSELDDFGKLMIEARSRGGYGFMGTSKKWMYDVQGLDESIRWCADIDLARRARFDKVPVIWISHGRAANRMNRYAQILHLTTHGKSIRKFGGADVTDIARRGKWFIHRTDGNREVVRNDSDWGIFTEEKLRRAFERTKMTLDDLNESLRQRREDPREWLRTHA